MPHIVRINSKHDRKSFDCGKPSMNDFLFKYGLSEVYGATWVLVPEPDSHQIMAYYTVRPDLVELDDDEEFEIVVLERLAVDNQFQGDGYGTELLLHVIIQVYYAAIEHEIRALELFALDDEAKAWYL